MSADTSVVVAGQAAPRARYPHLRKAGPLLFVSALSARRGDNSIPGAEVDERGTARLDIRAQTRAVIDNIRAVLQAAGSDLNEVVEVCAFLVDMGDFGAYNDVYNEYFDENGPARTTVAVHQLPHPHYRIEMKAVAYHP